MMRLATVLPIFVLLALSPLSKAEGVKTSLGKLSLNANLETSDGWPTGTTLLITHGTLSHSGSELMQSLQTLFGEHGLSSLAINLSLGIDNRQGPFSCDVTQRHRHEDASAEIFAWTNWLKAQGANSIVVLGHSRGGNQTARFVVDHSDAAVSAAILIAPALHDGKNIAQAYQKTHDTALAAVLAQAHAMSDAGKPHALLTPTGFLYCPDAQVEAASFLSYYETDADLSTAALLKQSKLPTLIISGSEDATVPGIAQALSPLAAAANVELLSIDGADHFFRDLYADELVEQAVEWLDSQH